jgi:hypothetical protein
MNWKKLKKVLIPLLIIKVLVFVFFIFKSDLISFSREATDTGSYQQGIERGSVVPEKQRLIKIVRNEGERGITIMLRSRKNAAPLHENKKGESDPIID